MIADYLAALEEGRAPSRAELVARHPELAAELEEFFNDYEQFRRAARELHAGAAHTANPADTPTVGRETPAPADPVRVRYFGDYELLGEIARGGMGVVYQARQVTLGRNVAVKMILSGQLATPADVERFRAEAQAAANLQHPHIVAIHEVGEHQGQHYFSMELVEGCNLAELVRESTLPAARAARYVRTVAEAIHYAHGRGVVHRDLKPSNVLIDSSDRPRITDFGLAMRSEERAALTTTGQVLGTPSYMPPEQAAGRREQIGPASDVYSLGAILYELVTGRPPFRAETPLDTILQVLEVEPASPRLLNPAVSRDLETIILKCLDKEPARRYITAQALADDLGAYLEGRPIAARPPSAVDRAGRWLRRQRRSVAVAVAAALAAALLLAGGWAARYAYLQSRLGTLSINTDAVALVADVLDEQGRSIVPRVGVPTDEPVSLPAGSYEVRVSGRSALSETYQLLVRPGQSHRFTANLDARQLGRTITVPKQFELVNFTGDNDLVLFDDRSIARVKLADSAELWRAVIDAKADPRWQELRWAEATDYQLDWTPRLVEPVDVSGDKIRDLVFALRGQAALAAVSGLDGKLLWTWRASSQPAPRDSPRTSTTAGAAPIADVDGDGVADLAVSIARAVDGKSNQWQRTLAAISGRSGKPIWEQTLPDAWFDVDRAQLNKSDLCWFPRGLGGHSSAGAGGGFDGVRHYRGPTHYYRSGEGEVAVASQPEVFSIDGRQRLLVAAGKVVTVRDAATGQPVGEPIHLGFLPVTMPKVADVDGDGRPEVLALKHVTAAPGTPRVPDATSELLVYTLAGKLLWQSPLQAEWGAYLSPNDPPADWPLVVDLDGDRRPEVVAPHWKILNSNQSQPYGGLAVLDGATGKLRWHAHLKSLDWQVNRFTAGPDIDGDGSRDLFAASLAVSGGTQGPEQISVFVDALSGKDGRRLWWHEERRREAGHWSGEGTTLGPLLWWHVGRDGWPQLLVPFAAHDANRAALFQLEASSGKLAGMGVDLRAPRLVDVDADGSRELLAYRATDRHYPFLGGELRVFRGLPQEPWRRVDADWTPQVDLDGDGVADLCSPLGYGRSAAAISGRDGRLLWQSDASSGEQFLPFSAPAPLGDLNGDGQADVLSCRTAQNVWGNAGNPLARALSGRDGSPLWTANWTPRRWAEVQRLALADLDGDGSAEILAAGVFEPITGAKPDDVQLQLGLLDARSGRLRWRRELSPPLPAWGKARFQRGWASSGALGTLTGSLSWELVDLDADGVRDILAPGIVPPLGYELVALSGATGAPLWRHRLGTAENDYYLPYNLPQPVVADLDGDGQPEALALDYTGGPATGRPRVATVVALDGASGKLRWEHREAVQAGAGLWDEEPLPRQLRPRPLVVRLDKDVPHRAVCIWAWGSPGFITVRAVNGSTGSSTEKSPGAIVVLDHQGKLLRRAAQQSNERFSLAAGDLDGDGADELVFPRGAELVAARARDGHELWKQPVAAQSQCFASVERAGERAMVVATTSGQCLAFDGRTGQRAWQSLPGHLAGFAPTRLATAEASLAPRFLYQLQGESILSQSLKPPKSEEPRAQQAARSLTPSPDDPRTLRPLFGDFGVYSLRDVALAGLAGVLVVAPAWGLVRAVRRKRFSLKLLLLVPAWVGLVLAALPLFGREGRSTWNLAMDALVGYGLAFALPVVVVVAAWIAVRDGRWWRLGLIAAVLLLVMGASIAGAVLRAHAAADPDDRFSWQGWHGGLLPSLVTTGGLVLLAWVVVQLWRGGLRFWLRRRAAA